MDAVPSDCDNCDALLAALRRGGRVKYLFFWGHTAAGSGSPGRECLSQWYPASFELQGVQYSTAEHYMMYQKALLFGDDEIGAKILAARKPGEAKALGRAVRGFAEPTWEERRVEIAVRGNLAKFSQSDALREFLLGTKDRVLVEASPVDCIWGIGLAADDPHAENPSNWKGLNLLGFSLMKVRERLLLQRSE